MNDQEIENIKNSLRDLMRTLGERGRPLTPELKAGLARVLEHAANRITQLRQQQPPTAPTQTIPQGAELIWVLAGGNPQAFTSYLRTFPDPAMNALAANPAALQNAIGELSQRVSLPVGESAQGVPRSELSSSNVYGFQYNPNSKVLRVKFQGNGSLGQGPVYDYQGVPPQIFKLFQAGAVPAKTSGSNKWGRWWKNKQPSLGAAMSGLIKHGGYAYQKVA